MFTLKKTTEQLIYEKTCQDEFEKFMISTTKEPVFKAHSEAFPNFSMNRLVYSLTYNEFIRDLSNKYHTETNNVHLGYTNNDEDEDSDYIGLANYIDLIKLGEHNFSFREAMDIIKQVREDLGPDVFYGAILANAKDSDVNPLHPLVMHEFMRFNDEELIAHGLTNYTIIIYTFKDSIKKLKKKYPEHFEIKKSFPEDIVNLISGTDFKQDHFSIIEDGELIESNNRFKIKYKEIITDIDQNEILINAGDEGNEYKQSYIVPGQILNLNGMIYPYYGAIYIKGGFGWNLSPMLATNISAPGYNDSDDDEYGGEICTKIGDNRTAEGCKTLNHSNTTSQMNSLTFVEGSMGYAQVAVDIALSTFYDDFNAKKHIVEYKKLTWDEFSVINPNKTRKDFLEYLRNRLKGKQS